MTPNQHPLKGIIVNRYFGLGGGAEVIARHIWAGLKQKGGMVTFMVAEKKQHAEGVVAVQAITDKLGFLKNLLQLAERVTKLENFFYSFPFGLLGKKYADNKFIHLHNVHGGFFSLLALPLLSRRFKVIWTLHDAWLTNSTSAYGENGDQSLDAFAQLPQDGPAINFFAKKLLLRFCHDLTIVCPSRWLEHRVRSSGVLPKHIKLMTINNGIELSRLTGLNKTKSREKLGLGKEQKVIYLQAGWIEDWKKGILGYFQSLPKDKDYKNITFMVTGYGAEVVRPLIPKGAGVILKDYLHNDEIPCYFSAADVYAFPSLFENYSTTLMESSAAGTAIVGFAIGGNPELITPANGKLVAAYNFGEFHKQVFALLEDDPTRKKISKDAQALAIAEFGIDVCVENYLKILNGTDR